MNTKKLLALLLAVVMVLGMAACGGNTEPQQTTGSTEGSEPNETTAQDDPPSSVTVETIYGSVEVPYAPERVCVLDSSVLDFIHVLGLGEHVVSVQSAKGTPAYLEEYYTSESIILLQREKNKNKGNDSAETDATEATTDPYEMYYSIDADLIIGTADTVDEELYAILSQIAPTIVTGYAIDNENGVYEGIKENARLIASIWGVEDKLDEVTAEYDALYQQLDEALDGVTVVMLNSSLDTNRVEVVSNDDIESNDDKREAERSGRIMLDLGMVMYSNDMPEEVAAASVYERNAEADAQAAKNKVITDWIEQVAPEYVLVVDRNFDSIEAAEAEGYDASTLTNLTANQAGKLFVLSYAGSNGASGLQGTFIQLDELAAIFLN